METASFSFGRWYARFNWFALALCILIFLAVTIAGGTSIVLAPQLGPVWSGVLVTAVGVWGLLSMAQWVRYRHTLTHQYVLRTDGISVASEGQERFIPWANVAVAEYLPTYAMIRLKTSTEPKPIVLRLIRGGLEPVNADQRNETARRLIEAGMGRAPTKRWFW